jgi:hypothetical protein
MADGIPISCTHGLTQLAVPPLKRSGRRDKFIIDLAPFTLDIWPHNHWLKAHARPPGQQTYRERRPNMLGQVKPR